MYESTSSTESRSRSLAAVHAAPSPLARRVDVVTGSRLHFGLLSLQDVDGLSFGGCGLMLRKPNVWVQARRADRFAILGAMPERCRAVVDRFVQRFDLDQPVRLELRLMSHPNAHSGLGSGTQIDLAVASALAAMFGVTLPVERLALEVAGRGRRSAIGVHAFEHGGLIAEAGFGGQHTIGKLLAAKRFPSHWRILLVRPREFRTPVHGELETSHFRRSTGEHRRIQAAAARRRLVAIMNDEIVPAAEAEDFDHYCDALARFNYNAGLLFADVQHSAYNGPQLQSLVELMQGCGCQGVGQSSWGPTIFSFCRDQTSAEQQVQRIRHAAGQRALDIQITQARNQPASCCIKYND